MILKKMGAKIEEISEVWIKEFILSIYSKRKTSTPWYFSYRDLQYEIMSKRKKDMKDVENVLMAMNDLGLEMCKVHHPDLNDLSDFAYDDMCHTGEYNLLKFAILRGYVKLVDKTYVKSD